ncbi:LppX_LprAFG lipoprotein [Kibdelosporangium philippinense]|uniref:LppX_LprAFG lipoprotein n=1 Tax=Kibdelosporangium philippinense TaxID=211113 RepID=A0ABS8ZKH4_9PSEU|nr:LppX_LprAFG lipoprotein [Kibdelosporangium philippinense]MCE7008299.1 LppX_LprAFG lipoprotein [Kibdelosporangium philippinense]
MFKRLLVLGMLGLVTATGCTSTSNESGGSSLPDGAALLKDAAEAIKPVNSATFALVVTGVVPGIPVKEVSGDLTKAGDAIGNAKLDQFGQTFEVQYVLKDKILYIKGITGSWQQFGDATQIYDPSAILDPNRGVAKLLGAIQTPVTEGAEDVATFKTYRVAGKVAKDVVAGLVPSVPSDVNVKVWVKQDGNHQPVRATVELTPGNSVEITLSEVDKPVTVTKPI